MHVNSWLRFHVQKYFGAQYHGRRYPTEIGASLYAWLASLLMHEGEAMSNSCLLLALSRGWAFVRPTDMALLSCGSNVSCTLYHVQKVKIHVALAPYTVHVDCSEILLTTWSS